MKTIQKLTLTVALCAMVISLSATSISFIQNNLELAKQKAASEGKLILVDFWAHWCSPCTWMDEYTFSNQELSDYLNENYISVRIDIDNIEGYAYKEEFQIRYLPSILILNDKGQLIQKYEESFAPSKLLTILKEHNKGGYNSAFYATANTSQYQPHNPIQKEAKPAPAYKPALSSDYASTTPPITEYKPEPTRPDFHTETTAVTTNDYYVASPSEPATNSYAEPSTNNTNQYYTSSPVESSSTVTNNYTAPSTSDDHQYYTPSPSNQSNTVTNNYMAPSTSTTSQYYADNSTETASTTANNYTSTTSNYTATTVSNKIDYGATGTYEFSVKPAPVSGYSVQVGAYYEYGNVLREVAAFQKQYMDVVYVHISKLNGANCYKILLGHFGTRTTAAQQKAFLKERGLDCFVKDLATM